MSDMMKNILIAIAHNSKQLLMTTFLAAILLYYYAILAFAFVDDTFWTYDVEPAGENMCMSLFQCFTTVTSLGPRSIGGIGDMILRHSYGYDAPFRVRYYVRWMYEVSIFFIINIIFLKLILGIILDTFGELRDKRKEIENDKMNICFICNLERYLFDKYSDGFENHTKRDHNLWNYLYFLYGLKKKDETEYSGLESFVVQEIFTESKDWVPLGKALCLKASGEDESMLENRVKNIEAEIELIEVLLQG